MRGIDLPETINRITFPEEVWEWLDLFGDASYATQKEAACHEDFRRDNPYRDVLVRTINKDKSTLTAIYVLLRCECIHQAAAHVRLLCNNLITLRYIAQDPESRADQFLGYAQIETYELANALIEWERNRADHRHVARLEAFAKEVAPAYQQSRPRYTFIDPRGRQRPFSNWCNKAIAVQARECGRDVARLYELVFKQMSSYVHGSAWSLRRQLAYSARHYRPDVVLNDVATILRTAIVVWVDWAKFCDEQLGWNLMPVAREIAEKLKHLDAKHFPVPE